MPRLPEHVKSRFRRDSGENIHNVKVLLRKAGLNTVCESARCPNLGECFGRNTAAFMILGNICTRSCTFCAVNNGRASAPDPDEPVRVARAARELGLKHVVVTSVTRDDLPGGGAGQFAKTIEAIRVEIPAASVEVLIPDFGGNLSALTTVTDARPDILNHNLETVPRIHGQARPQADYGRSLELIARAHGHGMMTKSGMMLGMGEKYSEVVEAMKDLRDAGCHMLVLGQYLRPTRNSLPVTRYLDPEEFDEYREVGLKLGFKTVMAGSLVRSSYRAGENLVNVPNFRRG